jgi:hypothetical protein
MNKYDQSKPGIRRQGDVLLVPVSEIPANAHKKEDNIVAYGESTGHYHQFMAETALVSVNPAAMFVEVIEPTLLQHCGDPEGHKPQMVPKGKYQVVIKRELDEVGDIQQVRD